MANEIGAFMAGPHLKLQPNTNGQIITDSGVTFGGSEQGLKLHAGYTGSGVYRGTAVVSTTGNTATVIKAIAVPSGYGISVRAQVLGFQDDASDASTYTLIGAATNAAGTTAMKGTALYQVVESNASCDCTITANDTDDTVEIKVTGITAENYAWICEYQYMLVKTSA